MRVGIVIPTYDRFARGDVFLTLASELERLGFDSAWFGDHIVFPADRPAYIGASWMDAMACACVGIGATSRLQFGTDVLVAPNRNPILLAKMAATASLLSGGRFQLGLGIGWLEGEFRELGSPPFSQRGAVTGEYLEAIRVLLATEGEASYSGRWCSFDRVVFEPRPREPLPILVGGNHARALRRAALLGDGWHPLFLGPEDYAKGRAEVERIRAEAGIERPFLFSLSGSQCRIAPERKGPERLRGGGERSSYAPAVGTDATGRQRFTGTAEEVRADCLALADAGVEQLVLRFAVPLDPEIDVERHLEQMRWFAADVLPACHSH